MLITMETGASGGGKKAYVDEVTSTALDGRVTFDLGFEPSSIMVVVTGDDRFSPQYVLNTWCEERASNWQGITIGGTCSEYTLGATPGAPQIISISGTQLTIGTGKVGSVSHIYATE